MKNINIIISFIFCIVIFTFAGCIDDSPVEYNEYSISGIVPPVDKMGTAQEKKVYIGHDLPVNVTITAKYDEKDVPVQFYLLNTRDVEEVEAGIGFVGDIRMYYCQRTPETAIKQLLAGTNSYGLVINVPAEDSKDELTGDFKTGNYYVVAEVNKNEDAEIDAYAVYQKFKNKLDPENIITVTTDFRTKPDLSIEEMLFTGGSDSPEDVMVWYNVDLNNLPGIENSGLDEDKRIIIIEPSEKDRNFTGTVHVKSSACDALNVPIVFRLKDGDGKPIIDLEIYDKSLGGWVEMYYIPILKANTTERITLGLRIPEDSAGTNYFSFYDQWYIDNPSADDYPLSAVRHAMGGEDKAAYGDYDFRIEAEVNPGGEITEARFIEPNADNTAYTEDNYQETGSEYSADNYTQDNITKDNNKKPESVTFTLEKVEVSPNEGIKAYPYCKMDPPDEDYRSLVIFWDGFELNVGDSKFGASAEAHEGMFFYNYSLYSLGIIAYGSVFDYRLYLINTFLNAQSHPFNADRSGFEFHIECRNTEGESQVLLSEAGEGHSENTWEYPIVLWSAEKEMEKWVYCFKFTLKAGVETVFTPGVNLNLNEDGSLVVDKFASLRLSVYADASASIAGLATVGLYTYLDILTLSLIQSCYTTAEYDRVNYPGRVKGTLNRMVGLYLIGPKGYIDLYLEVNFLFFSKRWQWNIFSFSSFTIPLLEEDFAGSGEYTNWVRLGDTTLGPVDTSDSE